MIRRSTGPRVDNAGAEVTAEPTRSMSCTSGALFGALAAAARDVGAYAAAVTNRDHHSRCARSDPGAPAIRQRQLSS